MPVRDSGHVTGFRIVSLVPESVVSKVGFQNDDVLLSVDGEPLTEPEQMLKLYTRLNDLKIGPLVVEILRAGERQFLNFSASGPFIKANQGALFKVAPGDLDGPIRSAFLAAENRASVILADEDFERRLHTMFPDLSSADVKAMAKQRRQGATVIHSIEKEGFTE